MLGTCDSGLAGIMVEMERSRGVIVHIGAIMTERTSQSCGVSKLRLKQGLCYLGLTLSESL